MRFFSSINDLIFFKIDFTHLLRLSFIKIKSYSPQCSMSFFANENLFNAICLSSLCLFNSRCLKASLFGGSIKKE